MKITEYPREERMFKDLGFIEIYLSFNPSFPQAKRNSFGILYNLDEAYMPAGSKGFGMHPHRDMEVVSLILEGSVHHRDNSGNVGVIHAKSVQIISAGTGIMHEEYNFSKELPFRGLQLFLRPKEKVVQPNYQKRELSPEDYQGKLVELLSPDGRNRSLKIANDSFLNYGILNAESETKYSVNVPSNGVFIKIIQGEIEVEGIHLREKDEIGIEDIETLTIKSIQKSEIMVFEVPMN
jgi:redox-sensitive bicupin YhaK (pirin superfamily)